VPVCGRSQGAAARQHLAWAITPRTRGPARVDESICFLAVNQNCRQQLRWLQTRKQDHGRYPNAGEKHASGAMQSPLKRRFGSYSSLCDLYGAQWCSGLSTLREGCGAVTPAAFAFQRNVGVLVVVNDCLKSIPYR